MTGVMMAIPGADFVLHNSLFLIAHFHNAIVGGVVFGYLAGLQYWFPKVFGLKPSEKLGKASFWCWFVGFYVAFVPIYVLGFMGATRRTNHYNVAEWQPYFIVAAIGAAIIAVGVVFQVLLWVMAFVNRNKAECKDVTGDPWDGRTLEWATSSPPAVYNFAVIPHVEDIDAFAHMKETGRGLGLAPKYTDIHMPSNTAAGLVIGLFSLVLGFAAVWHITWLAVLGFVGVVLTIILKSFGNNDGYYIPAAKVREIEERRFGTALAVDERDMVAVEAN